MSTNRIVNIRDQENSASANVPGNLVNKENTKPIPPRISKIPRIPLGGKNQNSNQFSLNRSQSSLGQKVPLARDTFRPPSLVKSNSSLGFIPPPSASSHQITVQRDVPEIHSKQPVQQIKPLGQKSEIVTQAKPSLPEIKPQQSSQNKRVLLQPVKDDLAVKKPKLESTTRTDSLVKPQPIERQPLATTLEQTFSANTAKLHASNIIEDDINRNNVDPVKKQPVNTRSGLKAFPFGDEVEITPSVREFNPQYPIEPLSETDLQFFSTPNTSRSEFPEYNQHEMILNAGIPDVSLDMSFESDDSNIEHHDVNLGRIEIVDNVNNFDEDSELGLSIADLHTLLD
ncbi:uncharacterized protein SPAPADRAFT_61034 [Spathaspora passalidarum NRRL Y-27907]|uniref:Securin n=1 Tax=Spathaspora passalidarum (strain NRRL Y-27907 / 11-Y1) TaxID=619300 RepID=G3ANE3_SPAPN|nr:uncharacterized protein SPAPADRAFT_61034 [Spathaspora passalidarum NRRL Y-27907]EGW31932.1 hypothetical protein SPAPADRAFT_61034 [Spathaspora passalidarum NRRL Y-27907]